MDSTMECPEGMQPNPYEAVIDKWSALMNNGCQGQMHTGLRQKQGSLVVTYYLLTLA